MVASATEMTVDTTTLASVREDLISLIKEKKCNPILVRIAWHDSGEYDAAQKSGGANGSVRFDQEMAHGGNAGLPGALKLLSSVKEKHPGISHADLFQMASAVSIELAGGPVIPMRYGRQDAEAESCPVEGRLPQAGPPFARADGPTPSGSCDDPDSAPAHLRRVFYRMGFNDQEIVLLSGAHSLGRAFKDRSGMGAGPEGTKFTRGVEGVTQGGSSWTPEWLKFSNDYFQVLMDPEADPELLKMPTDKALMEDPDFRKWVEIYAADKERFFEDYKKAHKKLSELGSVFVPSEGVEFHP